MKESGAFKLRLSGGLQTIRLDRDALDYDWKGASFDFHGTLPYENLRLKKRVIRKNKVHGKAAVFVCLMGVPLLFLVPVAPLRYLVVAGAVVLMNLAMHLTIQHLRGGTIAVQIEPQPFGFKGELNVPNSKKGEAFLRDLEAAWKESLQRRFLVHSDPRELRLQRIYWLEAIGVLTSEEAAAERALVNSEPLPEQQLIALN